MTVGKPNFNLNSFGIKYLSKDEVQEFLEKRTQGEGIGTGEASRKMPETKFDNESTEQTEYISGRHSPSITSTSRRGQGSKQVLNPIGQNVPKKLQGKRNRTGTSQLKETAPPKYAPSAAGSKQIDATITNNLENDAGTSKPKIKKPVDTKDTQFHYNEGKRVTGEGMLRGNDSKRGDLQTPTYSFGGRDGGSRHAAAGKPPAKATSKPNKGKKIEGQGEKVSTGKMVADDDGVKRNTARAVFEETQGTGQESKAKIGEMGAGKKELNDMISRKADNDTTRTYNKKIKEITAARNSKKGKAAYEALAASRKEHGDDNHHEHHNTIFGKYHGQDEKKLAGKKQSNIEEEKGKRSETKDTINRKTGRLSNFEDDKGDDLDNERGDSGDQTDDKTGIEDSDGGKKSSKKQTRHKRKLTGSHQGIKAGENPKEMKLHGSYEPTADDTAKDKKTTRAMRMYAGDIKNASAETIFKAISLKLDLMNKKSDDIDLDKIIEEETGNIKGKKGGGGHRSLATRLTSGQNVKKTAAETIFKAISLKLDLMKVSSFKGSPKLPKVPNVKLNTSTDNWNDRLEDPDDVEINHDGTNAKRIDWDQRNREQEQEEHWDSYGRDL